MKLKKAKKMLKELGVDSCIIRNKNEDDPREFFTIDTGKSHKLDDADIIESGLDGDVFEMKYELSSKKKKKSKKKDKKKLAYDEEISRIQRNLRHLKTGEGQYEESPEELAKREEQRLEQAERRRKYPPKGNQTNTNQNNSSEGNSHHQNQETIRNNRRYNGRNNRSSNSNNSYSNESGTKEITNKPESFSEKED